MSAHNMYKIGNRWYNSTQIKVLQEKGLWNDIVRNRVEEPKKKITTTADLDRIEEQKPHTTVELNRTEKIHFLQAKGLDVKGNVSNAKLEELYLENK